MYYKNALALLTCTISLHAYGQGPLRRSFSGRSELYTLYSNCDSRRLTDEQRRTLVSDAKSLAENALINSQCEEAGEVRQITDTENCAIVTVDGVDGNVAKHSHTTTIKTLCFFSDSRF